MPSYETLFENDDWILTERGLLSKPDRWESRYEIAADRLGDPMWVGYMLCEKRWPDPVLFVEALYRARRALGAGDVERTHVVRLPNRHLTVVRRYRGGAGGLEWAHNDVDERRLPKEAHLVDAASEAVIREKYGYAGEPVPVAGITNEDEFGEVEDVQPLVLRAFGEWATTTEGCQMGLSSFDGYVLEAARLGEDDWVQHIYEKEDGTFFDFVDALYDARRRHGVGETRRTRTLLVPDVRTEEQQHEMGGLARVAVALDEASARLLWERELRDLPAGY